MTFRCALQVHFHVEARDQCCPEKSLPARWAGNSSQFLPGVSISIVRTADNRRHSFASNRRQPWMIILRSSKIFLVTRLVSLDVLISSWNVGWVCPEMQEVKFGARLLQCSARSSTVPIFIYRGLRIIYRSILIGWWTGSGCLQSFISFQG